MTIEKIDTSDIILREHLAVKINEIIDEHNKLAEFFENHYHESLDTHYNTTGPKDGGPSGT